MNEYVVSYRTSKQVSPDDWDTFTPSLKVTNDTTIGQIMEWFKKEERLTDLRFEACDVNMKICNLKKP